jgi:hypothetical protein
MEKLTALGIQYRKMDAEEWFNADFAEMQENMPDIVCDKKGAWGGEYADKESLMRQIRPTLKKYGFSVRFDHPASPKEGQLVTECVLSHKGGHSVKNSIATRAGRPNKMMTEQQVDAGGYYAGERYALSAMLNIRADKADDDARFLGLALTDDELLELKQHAESAGADIANLCRQAGVEKIEDVRTGTLRLLHNFLNEKQRINAARKTGSAAAGGGPPAQNTGADAHGEAVAPNPAGTGADKPPRQPSASTQTPSVSPTKAGGGVPTAAPAPLDGPTTAEADAGSSNTPTASVKPTAPYAPPVATEVAKAWVEATPEAELLQVLYENPKQLSRLKQQAKVSGILEEFNSRDLKRVAYCWKLARLTEKK